MQNESLNFRSYYVMRVIKEIYDIRKCIDTIHWEEKHLVSYSADEQHRELLLGMDCETIFIFIGKWTRYSFIWVPDNRPKRIHPHNLNLRRLNKIFAICYKRRLWFTEHWLKMRQVPEIYLSLSLSAYQFPNFIAILLELIIRICSPRKTVIKW